MKKYNDVARYFPYILTVLFAVTPIFLSRNDMWDGSIIAYGVSTENLSGVKNWFYESGWFMQYWQIALFKLISDSINIDYYHLNSLIVSVCIILLVREVKWIVKNQIGLSLPWALLAASLTAVYPVWNIFVSSVMAYHLLCMVFGIIGLRFVRIQRYNYSIFGWFFLIFSYGLSSMVTLIPCLSYCYDILKNNKEVSSNGRFSPKPVSFLVSITAVLAFLIYRTAFPSVGLYKDYNRFISPFTFDGFLTYLINGRSFLSFMIYPLIGFTLIIGLFLIVASRVKAVIYIEGRLELKFTVVLLFISSIIPYIAVGKSTSINRYRDWNSRQGLLLSIVLPIITVIFMSYASQFIPKSIVLRKKILIFSSLVMLGINILTLSYGFVDKFNRQFFEKKIEKIIGENESLLPAGTLQIICKELPELDFNDYESNYLLYRTTGKAIWWSRIGNEIDFSFSVPDIINEVESYRQKYIYTNVGTSNSIIYLKVEGFAGKMSKLLNIFGYSQPIVRLERISYQY